MKKSDITILVADDLPNTRHRNSLYNQITKETNNHCVKIMINKVTTFRNKLSA